LFRHLSSVRITERMPHGTPTPGRATTLRQNDPFCASQRMDAEIPDAAQADLAR
jgi:hypothetical protein